MFSLLSYCGQAKTLTAIEVWLVACIVFIFLEMVEFATVLIVNKRMKGSVSSTDNLKQTGKLAWNVSSKKNNSGCDCNQTKKASKMSQKIDSICVWLFPSMFACFNALYWSIYLK